MYADNTLTPKEAVRLCALGTLATGSMTYAELAGSVRHFIDRVQGPSLDVLGSSVELLKYEGLVSASEGDPQDSVLEITGKGRDELKQLLTAQIRATDSDLNILIEALKFRFLHLLDDDTRKVQADLLLDRVETELARLLDLRQGFSSKEGYFVRWLEREIDELESRADWLQAFKNDL